MAGGARPRGCGAVLLVGFVIVHASSSESSGVVAVALVCAAAETTAPWFCSPSSRLSLATSDTGDPWFASVHAVDVASDSMVVEVGGGDTTARS